MSQNDDAWVRGLREGDARALDAVYAAYRPRVFSFLARACGDRALAEDLMQDTFVCLARDATRLRPDTRLKSWLFTVARNLLVDRRRRRRLGFDRLRELAARPMRQVQTPFDLAEASEAQAALERALLTLPEPAREAVLLCSVEGFAPQEAASMVGISPEAMRKRLSRGRAILREQMANRGGDER